jgi:hypothetical protein
VAHLALPGVGQTHDNEAVVQQLGVESTQGFFLAAVLGGGAHEGTTYFAHERALSPQATSAVHKALHLAAQVAVARGSTKNDGIVLSQLIGRGYGQVGKGLLRTGSPGFVQYFFGQRFGHALDYYFIAGYFAGTFGNGFGQFPDVAISGVKQNEGFHEANKKRRRLANYPKENDLANRCAYLKVPITVGVKTFYILHSFDYQSNNLSLNLSLSRRATVGPRNASSLGRVSKP